MEAVGEFGVLDKPWLGRITCTATGESSEAIDRLPETLGERMSSNRLLIPLERLLVSLGLIDTNCRRMVLRAITGCLVAAAAAAARARVKAILGVVTCQTSISLNYGFTSNGWLLLHLVKGCQLCLFFDNFVSQSWSHRTNSCTNSCTN